MATVIGRFVSRVFGGTLQGSILAIAALVGGCGPYVGTCSWIVPKAKGGIEVVAPRRPIPGECNCIGCKAPGEFVLRRDAYVIEFWNGERWDPDLFVRARSMAGKPLEIRSPRLVENRPVTVVPPRYLEFDYFLNFPLVGGKAPGSGPAGTLRMEIFDREGRSLGTEVVELELVTKKDVNIEWL